MITETHPQPFAERLEAGGWRAWAPVVAAPVAWIVLSSAYWFSGSRACADGDPAWGAISGAGVRALMLAGAVLALLAGGAGLRASVRIWRRTGSREQPEHAGAGVDQFVGIVGVAVGTAFVLAIVWTGLTVLLTRACEVWR